MKTREKSNWSQKLPKTDNVTSATKLALKQTISTPDSRTVS